MAAKKILATVLRERTESIGYRKIRSLLMNQAQNEKTYCLLIKVDDYSLTRLQNEGIKIEKITDFGTQKFRLSWDI